jgi:hypothetical protein
VNVLLVAHALEGPRLEQALWIGAVIRLAAVRPAELDRVGLELIVADAEAEAAIDNRRRDFMAAARFLELLN